MYNIYIYIYYDIIYVYKCIYICITCVCSDIVIDLHVGTKITPKDVFKC